MIRVEIAVDDDDDDAFSTATRDGEGQVSKSASRRRRSKQDARNPALVMSPRMCSCCDRCPFRNTPALSDSASNRRRFDGWDDGRDFVCLIPVTERGGGNSRSRSGNNGVALPWWEMARGRAVGEEGHIERTWPSIAV